MGKKRHTIVFIRKEFLIKDLELLSKVYYNNIKSLKYRCLICGYIGKKRYHDLKKSGCPKCGLVRRAKALRHNISFVRGSFEKEGYILLTEDYVNSKQKLKYICPKDHVGNITLDNWLGGHRCAECSGNKKHTIEFIRTKFEKEGYTLLTKKYINSRQKLEYICSSGHSGNICWDSWKNGARCLECAGLKKLTIEFVREQFKKEGYTLLSEKYVNSDRKLDYICPNGHSGSICWYNWKSGKRCRQCFIENNKGENHQNWNSNLTKENRLIKRNYQEYREWAAAIKERDNFTCKVCKKRGGDLVSHHLESYNNSPSLRTTLENGVCLCENCHNNFHHQYGYGNNTKKQFKKFIKKYNKNKLG